MAQPCINNYKKEKLLVLHTVAETQIFLRLALVYTSEKLD
jgi:hypothetical protein